jgi:hypothetical protein
MKAIANKKPPRPWFHDRLKVSGYTIIVNRIGAISMSITAKLGLNPNNFVVVVYFLLLLSETPVCLLLSLLLLLNKLHFFQPAVENKNVLLPLLYLWGGKQTQKT